MGFSLHPCVTQDAEDITRIFQAAFADDHIIGHFHPHTPKDVYFASDVKFFKLQIEEQGMWGGKVTKVVDDETGKTVAWSKWDYPYEITPEKKELKERLDKERKEKETRLEGSNDSLMDDFFKQLFAGRKKWIVPGETYFLHILAVEPSYQRRGLGTMLIRPGLEAADKAGAQTFIEASPSGLGLYIKHGWRVVDELVIDMKAHGVHGHEDFAYNKCLMREPGEGSLIGKVDVGKLTG